MMRGYVVSKGGTFGVVERNYIAENGQPCIVVSWGPLGWLTPLYEIDCKQLSSRWEREAREEADAWLASLEPKP